MSERERGGDGSDAPSESRRSADTSSARGTRSTVQRRLEALVREHRFTIAVVFPLVGATTLLASDAGVLPGPLAYNPLFLLFGTAVMRSPLVVGLLPTVDRRALSGLAALTLYTYAIETVGVRTDWPYGAFEYSIQLGPMLFGEVPLALPLFFVPLVLNAYLLTLSALERASNVALIRLPVAILAVVAVDLVLDPGAVSIGFWTYDPAGTYYGVPASNYLGWLLSGTVAVILVDLAFDRSALRARVDDCEFVLDDLVSFTVLWGAINVIYGNWLAAGVALLFCAGLFRTDRYDLGTITSALSRRWENAF
ncbi:bisanhydrobacterioruberin hydratase [Halostagnicola kamekurae]|uniref:Putative membrane protein n=1 Tax=Halostagnicola kamekurae TaxID=619731 RepID=A0A1I6Q5G1_9EURY|nr:bisanhydrobacterioruberin hydratase [Halostagnicola kamekurae]SFS47560.1 putative membrane protein [Halostagnicola kamekurae]